MPGGDRTGPLGMGPGSGRRLGFCAGYDNPGVFSRFGFGICGRGFWRRNFVNAPFGRRFLQQQNADPASELEALKAQATVIKNELHGIEERIKTLSQKQPKEGE